MSSTDFYRAFEERYRGSRELIRTRLQAYLPFITPLPGIYQHAQAIDLGCGRGEWLELLQGAGFTPQGVDLDTGMLAACTERGLPVVQGDALVHLQSLDDASQCLVSGFHLAEHLPFHDLKILVQQALRVLKPGGLLILETPNPENIEVGTSSFYLDPTHQRPLPPLLLSFLTGHCGFVRVHTLRLQESPELRQRSDIALIEVLSGVSPDYAVVAQKAAPPEILAHFDPVFAIHHGITLPELANRFDDTLQRRFSTLDQHFNTLNQHFNTLNQHFSARDQRFDALETEHNAMLQSASWRMTAPLRRAGGWIAHSMATARTSVNQIISHTIHTFQQPLSHLMTAVLRRPQLSYRINQILLRYPALYRQLLDVARRNGTVVGAHKASTKKQVAPWPKNLSPRARQIHADLQAAIKKNQRID